MTRTEQAVAVGPAPETLPQRRLGPVWWQLLALAAIAGFLYYEIIGKLVHDWWTDPNFSHGFFVPAFSAFVAWQMWDRLRAIPIRPSYTGACVIAAALLALITGVLGAELFLSRASLLLLLAGFIIYFLGWGWMRAAVFPWAVLFLMIPIPAIVFNQITLPLQLLASRLATGMLSGLGVPVLREGNIIQLPIMSLEVAEACSGIRSLVSLCTLAVIYGYFLEKRAVRRLILVAFAVPIAVFANAFRITGTGLVAQYWDPSKAEGFFHEFSGWIIFVVSLALLLVTHRLARIFWSNPKAASGSAS
jgi:exosortase